MNDEAIARVRRTRSPGYPAIGLEDAVSRAAKIWDKAQRHEASASAIATYWGISDSSSALASHLAALKRFGLIEDVAGGSGKQARLTALGIEIVTHPVGSQQRKDALKKAALNPKIYSEILERFSANLPDDSILSSYLLNQREFNRDSVPHFLRALRNTISFAGLSNLEGAPQGKAEISLQVHSDSVALKQETQNRRIVFPSHQQHDAPALGQSGIGVLATTTFPLGENWGEITIRGQELSSEDFDALEEYVQFWKRQFARKLQSKAPAGISLKPAQE